MQKNVVRIPEKVLHSLRETAAFAGGVGAEELLSAAVWAFSQQDGPARQVFVREFWLRGYGDPSPQRKRKTLKEKLYGLVRRVGAAFRKGDAE